MKPTDNMIDRMKSNLRSMVALRLPPPDGQPDLADALDKMDITDLLKLTDISTWIPCIRDKRFRSTTYRLRPDYEPEPEFLPCPNCGSENIIRYSYYAEVFEIFQRQCASCQLSMESDILQSEADRRWNEMAGEMAGRLWI